MISPVFEALNASSVVKSLLGNKPLRVFPWGEAPQNVAKPYVTYGVVNGTPQNNLDCPPRIDQLGTDIDIWALTGRSCEDCYKAIRDVLEPLGHMTRFHSLIRDPETKLYNIKLEFDFWTGR